MTVNIYTAWQRGGKPVTNIVDAVPETISVTTLLISGFFPRSPVLGVDGTLAQSDSPVPKAWRTLSWLCVLGQVT